MMRKTKLSNIPVPDRLLVSIPDFASYCSSGRYTAEKIAAQAEAVVIIGGRKFVNMGIARKYLESIAE